MGILNNLGLQYETDKASHGHNYLDFYEQFLWPLRDQKITLLEIGVGGGSSLRMWRDYFLSGLIIGLDIVDKKEVIEDRIRFEQGDQADPDVIRRLGEQYGPFDIVVDDGGHDANAQMASYRGFRQYMKRGGFYILEDVEANEVMKFLTEIARAVIGNRAGDADDAYAREHGGVYESIAFYRETTVSKLK